MRLDQIQAQQVSDAVTAFVDDINKRRGSVCATASSLRNGKPFRIFDTKMGSFNLCYFLEEVDGDGTAPFENSTKDRDRSVVRIPLIPRLGCPEEKLRSEIATMKFISAKTSIRIPKLYGYSTTSDNPIGVPFMVIEYIDATELSIQDVHDKQYREHILRQLGRLFLELYQLPFDRIGSFALDDEDISWTFGDHRPLQSMISEQELAGLQPSDIIPPGRTYNSTVDYSYALTGLAFNDWIKSRDAVFTKDDAENDLYDLYKFRSCVVDWVMAENNHGPYYLIHGDLLPSNILVNSNRDFVAIIDWEWCRTVPAELFVPPAWICGLDISYACCSVGYLSLFSATDEMQNALLCEIEAAYPQLYSRRPASLHPLAKLWRGNVKDLNKFCIAHSLLRPDNCITVYANNLDRYRHGLGSRASRVSAFYSSISGRKARELVLQKVEDGRLYKEDLRKRGMELQRETFVPLRPEDHQMPSLGGMTQWCFSTVFEAWRNHRWLSRASLVMFFSIPIAWWIRARRPLA
ncbi:hypothetical protein TPAR_04517 [Tolypocladium paradoxum]|uniref:Aminoglycoside phosphotransferase domain-containing protein n=1 Tax=Tolypocladium paradoxum TaxID=94208 RepID=A0A2S4KYP4_9HYPO|nr:hypothetical protein TPAR_04517 [Tolypocladium paradoxum]